MSENQQLPCIADPVRKEVQSSASIHVWLALSSTVPVKDQLAAVIDIKKPLKKKRCMYH